MPWHCISVVLCGGLYAEYKTCHVTLCTNYVVTNRNMKNHKCAGKIGIGQWKRKYSSNVIPLEYKLLCADISPPPKTLKSQRKVALEKLALLTVEWTSHREPLP